MTLPTKDELLAAARERRSSAKIARETVWPDPIARIAFESLAQDFDATATILERCAEEVPTEGYVLMPLDVVRFLEGAAPLDGIWFHENKKPDGERGYFWWRKYLAAAQGEET